MTRVFISYASEDSARVVWIEEHLHKAGVETFKFERDLVPGVDWIKRLETAMDECQGALLVLSKNSVRSPWCHREQQVLIGLGIDVSKTVVPVLFATPKQCGMGLFLRYGFQWVDLRDTKNIKRVADAFRIGTSTPITARLVRSTRIVIRPIVLFAAILIVLTLLPFAVRIKREIDIANFRETQREAQAVDDEVEKLLKANALPSPSGNGETSYYRPESGVLLATDVYEDKALKRRKLFREGHIVAVDVYSLNGKVIAGKTRSHLDSHQMVYLMDEFDNNGLRVKQYCPEGKLSDCISFIEEQQSPFSAFTFLPGFRY